MNCPSCNRKLVFCSVYRMVHKDDGTLEIMFNARCEECGEHYDVEGKYKPVTLLKIVEGE